MITPEVVGRIHLADGQVRDKPGSPGTGRPMAVAADFPLARSMSTANQGMLLDS
jgi:hypothetical protein